MAQPASPLDVASLLGTLLEPLAAVGDPTRRVYWPFLVSAAGLSALIWLLRVRKKGPSLLGFLLPRSIWLHRSALLDYRYLLVRALLSALLLGPAVVSAQRVAVGLGLWLARTLGTGPFAEASRAWAIAAFSLLAFVLRDLGRFLVHMATHRIPALWELHKVHHSAEVLTPFTLNRTHPLEGALMRGASALALGLAGGLCAWLFRGRVSAWEILGVDALTFGWALLGSNLRHSHVWLSFGPRVERFLLSPAQHQIHHSVSPEHHDRNFGEALAIWDRLAGTLYVTRGRERLTFGLPPGEQNHRPEVLSMLWSPLVAAAKRLGARGSGR